jgi:type IV pilus assembly protein PilN
MRNIDNSPWMGRSDLRKIENKTGTKDADKKMPYQFSLEVKLHKPDDAKKDEAAKDAAGGSEAGAAATTAKPTADQHAGVPPVAVDNKAPAKAPAPVTTGEKK